MANHCTNDVNITHSDPAKIHMLEWALEQDKLFETFVGTCPSDMDWHEWADKYIGCSRLYDWEMFSVEDNEIQFGLTTGWHPPSVFYKILEKLHGYKVEARYYENGNCIVGTYENGELDHYEWDHDWTAEQIKKEIPEDLIEYAGMLDEVEWI